MRAGRALLAACALAGCDLTEVTIVESEDVVIVEALVQVDQRPGAGPSQDRAAVFLHRTLGADGGSEPVPGATVVVTGHGGASFTLAERPLEDCAIAIPENGTGTCYAGFFGRGTFVPGEVAKLRIDLFDGGLIESVTRMPGDFDLLTPSVPRCVLAPERNLEIVWTQAQEAWAYVSETRIAGLRAALAPLGIEVVDDPLSLTGLSVSAADTSIIYPAQLGLFSRTELDHDLSVELQKGLPGGTEAEVTVAAVDRNFVNWARGGNFNPSGPVRVPSVTGDGTGFFGSALVRGFDLSVADPLPGGLPDCGPSEG